MLPVDQAVGIILDHTQPNSPMEVGRLEDALGCVVAESVCARQPLPPFPASVKDGYAVISSDGRGERRVFSSVTAGEEVRPHLLAHHLCLSNHLFRSLCFVSLFLSLSLSPQNLS